MFGALRIPDAAAPIDVAADLRAGRVTVSTDIDAPREGRSATRVNWLVRQLRDAPDGLRIDAFVANSRNSMSELLRAVRVDSRVLISDPKRELRTFRIAATSPVGAKRGVGRGGFIDSVLAAIDGFYASVVQELRPWAPRAPQLSKRVETAVEVAGIDVSPPPQDLGEPGDEEMVSPPDEVEPPADVIEAIRSDYIEPAPIEVAAPPSEELVSWDGAHARLEHERSHDTSVAQDADHDGTHSGPDDENRISDNAPPGESPSGEH